MPPREPRRNSPLDRMIVVLLLYLFATLPFAVVDFSLTFSTFNRLVLLGVASLCALSALAKRSFRVPVNGLMIVVVVLVLHTLISMLRAGRIEYLRELANLLTLMCIAGWSRDVPLDTFVRGVIAAASFYCVDVFFQYLVGVDLFGFVPRNNRYWGAYYFGAPTFGTFLSFILLVPFFHLRRRRWRIAFTLLFVVAMVVSNDRSPVVQSALALFLFAPIGALYRVLLIGCALVPILFVTAMDPAVSNRVLAMYWGLRLLLLDRGSPEFQDFLNAYGFGSYFDVWRRVLTGWFYWGNMHNVLFGTGWGSVLDSLKKLFAEVSRPHSIHIDLIVSWGIIGYAIFLGWVVRLYKEHRQRFVMFAPCVLPMSSFSLTSANYLFMMTISFILFMAASDRRRELLAARVEPPPLPSETAPA